MKCCLLFLCLLSVTASTAQIQIEYNLVGASATGEFNVYNTPATSGNIPYERIRGSAFLNDHWQLASLYSGSQRLCILPVRLNLATQEIHYLQNGKEMVAKSESGLTAVILHTDNDTTRIAATFLRAAPGLQVDNNPVSGFLRQLNEGPFQLLKFIDRKLVEGDSLSGTYKRYFFKDYTTYFLQTTNGTKPVKKMNEESLFSLLPQSSLFRDWIKDQKLNLKKEDDLLKFMAHYNANLPGAPK